MIKTLVRCVREYKWDAILGPVTMIGEVYMETRIPLVLAKVVDLGVSQSDMGAVVRYGGLLMLYALISLIFGVASAVLASRAATGFARNLRHDMYYKVQEFDFANIDRFSTASIVTRLTTDTTNVQNAFQMLMRMAIRAPVMLIFSMIVSFRISRDISMTFLIILPILALALFFIIRSVFPVFTRVFRKGEPV